MEKFEKVLVRHTEQECWKIDLFSHIEGKFYYCMTDYYSHCIPFEGNEELLNTAKVPEKIVPVMYKDVKLSNIQSIINQNIALLNSSSAVSCETHEQYLKVTSILEKLGFKWCTGKSYSELDHWDVYEEKTILFPGEGQYWDSAEGRHNLFSAEYFIAVFETAFGTSVEYDIANKKHAVHCSTKELALKVLDIATSLGYDSWRSGESFKSNCRWEIEGNDTVYYLADRTRGYLHVAKDLPGHFVIEAEDFIKKFETKSINVKEYDINNKNHAVLCPTEELATEVLSIAASLGYDKWKSGQLFVEHTFWESRKKDTLYYLADGTFGALVNANKYGTFVINAEDFIKKYRKSVNSSVDEYDISKENCGVLCSSEKEAIKVLKVASQNGYCEWCDGAKFVDTAAWEDERPVYYIAKGTHAKKVTAEIRHSILISGKDFIEKYQKMESNLLVHCSTKEITQTVLKIAQLNGKCRKLFSWCFNQYENNTYIRMSKDGSWGDCTKFTLNATDILIEAEDFIKKFSKVEKPKAIHCPTLREAVIVLSILAAEGHTWAEDPNRWGINLGDTVYYADEHGGFGNINNVDTNKFDIVKASDFIANYPNFDSNMKETNDKVYFIGDEISGPEYIQKMENLGIANPFGYKGAINNFIYFNFNGEIVCIGESSSADIAKCVLNTYTKLC